MTNYERIKNMNKREMEIFLDNIIKTQASAYADIESWLNSEDPDMAYKGSPGYIRTSDGTLSPCMIIKEEKICGTNYCHIIMDGMVLTVPREDVTFESRQKI